MTTPIFHQFTFGPDGACSLESCSRVRKLWPTAPILVWEDREKPLSPEARAALTSLRAEVRPTIFHRNGNLRGKDCFAGMVSCYRYSVDALPGHSHIVKLDSDTLILRHSRLDSAIRDGVYAASWSFPKFPFSGALELLSADAVREFDGTLASGASVPGAPVTAGEDVLAGAYATFLAGPREIRRWEYDPAGGFAASYQYTKAQVPLAEYVRRFDVVTFGSRNLMPPEVGNDCDRRLEAAATMAKARKLLA